MFDQDGPLRRAASSDDLILFELLNEIIDRKLAIDAANNEEFFEDGLIEYADFPFGKPAYMRQLLDGPRYQLPMISDQRTLEKIDRRASMLSGPFYTSGDSPWLGEPGRIFEPLLQLDLNWAGKAVGVDLSSGLLQVWSDFPEILIRVIKDLKPSSTAVPSWASHLCEGDRGRWFNQEARESNTAVWLQGGHQIVGIGQRRRDLHQALPRFLETEVLDRAGEYPRALVSDSKKALRLMAQSDRPVTVPTSVDAALFGNYHPWNWDAGLETVLVNIESDNVLCFRGEGQGTLFVDHIENNPTFRFEWGL